MNKKLFQIAAQACLDVYKDHIDLGSGTQIAVSLIYEAGNPYLLVPIAGSNEKLDWFGNFSPRVKKGVKRYAYFAAERIHNYLMAEYPHVPVIACGHSRGGPVAVALKRHFNAAICICFSPARSLALWAPRPMVNTTLFIDPDDPVSRFYHWFRHPKCQIYRAADDHFFPNIGDHGMENWVKYVETMQEIDKNR